jgi:hypothetical protein
MDSCTATVVWVLDCSRAAVDVKDMPTVSEYEDVLHIITLKCTILRIPLILLCMYIQ